MFTHPFTSNPKRPSNFFFFYPCSRKIIVTYFFILFSSYHCSMQATFTSMHINSQAHSSVFISLFYFLSTCFSFLVVCLSSCNFSCNLFVFSVFVLQRFYFLVVFGFVAWRLSGFWFCGSEAQWFLVFVPICYPTKVLIVVAMIAKILSCSRVPSVVASIVAQQRFYICYFSKKIRNVESTKICVVGHSHPSSSASSGMLDHVLWSWT